ncbi:MAG TPA: HAD-IA family hydrolase [Pyrinomonadaceae bacterium]|nr:HAD-IA family hydrolase [Pyrinomonadaceae bacterium]
MEGLLEVATSADDAERSKPHPDIFQASLRGTGDVEPEEWVVIGDTPYDLIAAGKAGMRAIGLLSGGFSKEDLSEAGAVEIYKGVADLLEHYDE